MKNPTISIIIPAYNAEKTILATIASVQKQTFTDWELIVINDGSVDKTLEVLNTIKEPRMQVYSYTNGGVSVARNLGINHASGEYIAFLDADDLWTPDKLEMQLEALKQNPEADVVYSWAYYLYEQKNLIKPSQPIYFQGDVFADLLIGDFIISCSNCLITKQAIEAVGEFDPEVPGAADWDYWLRLAKDWQFVVVPKYHVYYRFSLESMQSNVEFMERCCLKVIDKGFQIAPIELQSLKNQSLANTFKYLAHLLLTRVKTIEAAKEALLKLSMAVRLHLPILIDGWTIKLFIKAMLMWLIPYHVLNNIRASISRFSSFSIAAIND